MAKLELTNVPRQLEMATDFEADDMSLGDIQKLKREVADSDLEDQLRNAYGNLIDQAAFIRATWSRFQQFVQKVNQRTLDMAVQKGRNMPSEVMRDSITKRFDVR